MPTRSERQAGRINAVTLLKNDHAEVKRLFDEFERASGRAQKKRIARQALQELDVHAAIEEEMFYPALRQSGIDAIMEEADEEHHVAKMLIGELEMMTGDEYNFDAKFLVLSENVLHHIREEETEMFPQAKTTDVDLEALGQMMSARKQELMSAGVPPVAEKDMIKSSGLMKESVAKRNAKTFSAPKGIRTKKRRPSSTAR